MSPWGKINVYLQNKIRDANKCDKRSSKLVSKPSHAAQAAILK